MLRKAFDVLQRRSARARRLRSKYWYRFIAAAIKDAPVVFLNYGCAGLLPHAPRIELLEEDESNRFSIQLYHLVVSVVNLTGRDVVEVGCGRGGGASYVARYLKPRSFVGVDITEQSLLFCATHHKADSLIFLAGDAERLPFADGSFDIVVNVESSHCYGDLNRFFGEVVRVLRPRGYFLFADRHFATDVPALRAQLLRSGLEIIREENITPCVLQAMEQDSARRLRLIRRYIPPLLHSFTGIWAGLKGSAVDLDLASGRMAYMTFALRMKDGPD